MLHLKLNNESGMAMIVAVMATFLGVVLAGSYMSVVLFESRHSVWQKHRAQSLFLAEAGIEKALYYLNNTDDPDNPWVDDYGQVLDNPTDENGNLAEGNYSISLYDRFDEPWIPTDSYLVKSVGTIPRPNSKDVVRRVSCVAAKLGALPIPAALSILDDGDPEDELEKFQSAVWEIDGKDMDDPLGTGIPGIAVANSGSPLDGGDDIVDQLGSRLDQVEGGDAWGNDYVGADAILGDPDLPKNLDAYANYFRRIALDASGLGNLPSSFLGTSDEFQVVYADLSKCPDQQLKIAGHTKGYGVLVLDGEGEFEMAGNSEWRGVIICASSSIIRLKGGGETESHIYGSLLISDGTVEMNGRADIVYSSDSISKINSQLLLYQVYAWCDGWGVPLGSEEY